MTKIFEHIKVWKTSGHEDVSERILVRQVWPEHSRWEEEWGASVLHELWLPWTHQSKNIWRGLRLDLDTKTRLIFRAAAHLVWFFSSWITERATGELQGAEADSTETELLIHSHMLLYCLLYFSLTQGPSWGSSHTTEQKRGRSSHVEADHVNRESWEEAGRKNLKKADRKEKCSRPTGDLHVSVSLLSLTPFPAAASVFIHKHHAEEMINVWFCVTVWSASGQSILESFRANRGNNSFM